MRGQLLAIEVLIGDLSTPDIDVTDDTYSKTFLSVDGVAADTVYYPSEFLQAADASTTSLVGTSMKGAAPAVCMGNLKTVVTGGGANKTGHIKFLYA
jgi:hypothetical protein